jgi:hypothetical protein
LTKSDRCDIIIIMKPALFNVNIPIMTLSKHRLLYRVTLHTIIGLFLVQMALLIAALAVREGTLPQVAVEISTICNALSLIASLISHWIDFTMNTGIRDHATIWEELSGIWCNFLLPMVIFHAAYIVALVYSAAIFLSADDAFTENRLHWVLYESCVAFVAVIIRLILYSSWNRSSSKDPSLMD